MWEDGKEEMGDLCFFLRDEERSWIGKGGIEGSGREEGGGCICVGSSMLPGRSIDGLGWKD